MTLLTRPRGLSFRIIVIIFANVLVITAAIFTYIYKMSHDTILSNLKENSRLLTSSTVGEVEKVLTSVQKMPDNLSRIIESGDYTSTQLQDMLTQAVANNEDIYGAALSFEPDYHGREKQYSAIYVYKDNGTIRKNLRDTADYSYHVEDWYLIPRQLKRPLWSEPYFDEGFGNVVMSTYSVPLYRTVAGKRTFIGILTADLSLEWLQRIVSSIKVYQTGYAFMVSRNGSIVTHPQKQRIMNETIFSIAEEARSPELREIGRHMIHGETSFAELEYRNVATGKLSWISYAPVKVNGWSLGIVYPVDELTSSLNNLFQVVIILAVLGALVLLGAIVLVSRSITRPIRDLAFATQKIAEGSFDIRLPAARRKDEISELTTSFGVMQGALKQTIGQLKHANDELEQYSRTLEERVEARTADLQKANAQLDRAIDSVRTLSDIGRQITSMLDLESIVGVVYENVNKLLDASCFTLMVLDEKGEALNSRLAIENGERLPPFSYSTGDKNRFAVWCLDNKKPVFINDVDTEYSRYIATRSQPKAGRYVSSLIYLPLVVGPKTIGVLSVQSFTKNAYTEGHLDILSNLANYAAIALDNASAYENVNRMNKELTLAQNQLVQAEKMASLGQLTAGIAHEIKNPLNFINNFSELSIDLSKELVEEIEGQAAHLDPATVGIVRDLLKDIDHNVRKINEHGKRADSIVKGMLLHSRGKAGEKQMTNLNDLLAEYLGLAYHGFRAQDASFNVKMETAYDTSLGPVNVVPQNLSRVFLNILNNACYSVNEKKKERKDGYEPILRVSTKNAGDSVEIRIRDNGKGIPPEVLTKVFNPFFTTKPTGKGTGLGLSLSYDIIVQEHQGRLDVVSGEGEFAEFIITIPKNL